MSNLIVTSKKNCSAVTPSACVPWSGFALKSFDISGANCHLNIDDIILNIDDLLKKVSDSVSTTSLSKQCLNVEDVNSLNSYVKALVSAHCKLQEDFNNLKADFEELDIFQKELNIDISCVTGGNNCGTGNVHTLANLITTLYNELCIIKKQIN